MRGCANFTDQHCYCGWSVWSATILKPQTDKVNQQWSSSENAILWWETLGSQKRDIYNNIFSSPETSKMMSAGPRSMEWKKSWSTNCHCHWICSPVPWWVKYGRVGVMGCNIKQLVLIFWLISTILVQFLHWCVRVCGLWLLNTRNIFDKFYWDEHI